MQTVFVSVVLAAVVACVLGHGQLTHPMSRALTTINDGGDCYKFGCMWFTDDTVIPGNPTVNEKEYRTINVNISSGPKDWTRKMPSRAPGTAPVRGSGCGIAAGASKCHDAKGATAPPGYIPGADAMEMPPTEPVVWTKGDVVEVAWSIYANHGGLYQYRICKNDGKNQISEECFQQTPLKFVGHTHKIRYQPLLQKGQWYQIPDIEIEPLVLVTEGVHPAGSEWAKNPIPACHLCNEADVCEGKGLSESDRVECGQRCTGINITHCPPYMTQFEEPAPGLSGGYTWHDGYNNIMSGFKYSIVNDVQVPEDIESGHYLLSWRWDCEQAPQIWQLCADIYIAGKDEVVPDPVPKAQPWTKIPAKEL